MPHQIYGLRVRHAPGPRPRGTSDPVWAGGRGYVAVGHGGGPFLDDPDGMYLSFDSLMAHELNHNLDRGLPSGDYTWGQSTCVMRCVGAGDQDPDWPYDDAKIQEWGLRHATAMDRGFGRANHGCRQKPSLRYYDLLSGRTGSGPLGFALSMEFLVSTFPRMSGHGRFGSRTEIPPYVRHRVPFGWRAVESGVSDGRASGQGSAQRQLHRGTARKESSSLYTVFPCFFRRRRRLSKGSGSLLVPRARCKRRHLRRAQTGQKRTGPDRCERQRTAGKAVGNQNRRSLEREANTSMGNERQGWRRCNLGRALFFQCGENLAPGGVERGCKARRIGDRRASQLPGGKAGKLRVVSSDGFNTTRTESEIAFTVENKPPRVTITSPPIDQRPPKQVNGLFSKDAPWIWKTRV